MSSSGKRVADGKGENRWIDHDFYLTAGLVQACGLPGWSGASDITAEDLQFTQIAMTVIALQQADDVVETGGEMFAPAAKRIIKERNVNEK